MTVDSNDHRLRRGWGLQWMQNWMKWASRQARETRLETNGSFKKLLSIQALGRTPWWAQFHLVLEKAKGGSCCHRTVLEGDEESCYTISSLTAKAYKGSSSLWLSVQQVVRFDGCQHVLFAWSQR